MESELPPPCEECQPEGLWIMAANGGMTRCHCPRGQALLARSNRPIPPQRAEPILTADEISAAVEGLSAIPFFPGSEMARTMIGDALGLLCADGRSAFELVRRMLVMYQSWPGVREMRICYCAVVGPPLSGEDLHLAISEFYPDGFGPSVPTAPVRLMLPAGHEYKSIVHETARGLNRIGPEPPQCREPVQFPHRPTTHEQLARLRSVKAATPEEIEAVKQQQEANRNPNALEETELELARRFKK